MGKVLKRILLINWHYIDFQILDMNRFVNFFTGHSGSGKSTIIDAIQIILLGDTRGERFFNKAAKDYSDRTLIEYLRGRRLDGTYLRNKNFTSYILMEFFDEKKGKNFCIGVVFGVDVAVNKYNHTFFYMDSSMPDDCFIKEEKPIMYDQFKEAYKRKATLFSTNKDYRDRFLIQYMGKLNPSFFDIFKKSISFDMDADIKDFIKNFICEDKLIEVEEMQENIRNYKILEKTIADVEREIAHLVKIEEQYDIIQVLKNKKKLNEYFIDKKKEESSRLKIDNLTKKIIIDSEESNKVKDQLEEVKENLEEIQKENEDLNVLIRTNDVSKIAEDCQSRISFANEKINLYKGHERDFNDEIKRLKNWNIVGKVLTITFNDIVNKISNKEIHEEELAELKRMQSDVMEGLKERDYSFKDQVSKLDYEIENIKREITDQEQGIKSYNPKLTSIKEILETEISKKYNKEIKIDILADVIEINNEKWRNAIEGYMGFTKFNLLIDPIYYEEAMKAYEALRVEEKHRAALVDIERIMNLHESKIRKNAATLIETENKYAAAYVNYLLGNVVMCSSVEETRNHKIGITETCMVYRGYILRALNEKDYTKNIAIGTNSKIRKIEHLKIELKELISKRNRIVTTWNEDPCSNHRRLQITDIDRIMRYHGSMSKMQEEEEIKKHYEDILSGLDFTSIDGYKDKLIKNEMIINTYNRTKENLGNRKNNIEVSLQNTGGLLETERPKYLTYCEKLNSYQQDWIVSEAADENYQRYIQQYHKNVKPEDIIPRINDRNERLDADIERESKTLYALRNEYNETVENRFDAYSDNNDSFMKRKRDLEQDALPKYKDSVLQQKEKAIIQFRDDFIYKMQDSIEDVKGQFDELNRSIAEVKFGKDKYRFIVKHSNNPEYKRFYNMFVDRDIISMPNSLFSEIFQKKYEETLNDLFDKIIYTSDDLTQKDKEKIEKNIRIYSDYRTYLDFDMESVSEQGNIAKLSKELSKNSGGEGQNPLYVILLSAFVRLYRISQENRELNHTLRLVVFDEAFNQMDAEKVKISLDLIRQLKFQAIVVAPNDKMQNYIESSEKTFIFNNVNNNEIEIASFEKADLLKLIDV